MLYACSFLHLPCLIFIRRHVFQMWNQCLKNLMEPISRTATVNILAVRLQVAGSIPILLTSHFLVLTASMHIIYNLSTESEWASLLMRCFDDYCLLPLLMAMWKSMHESERKKNLKNWYSYCSKEKIDLSWWSLDGSKLRRTESKTAYSRLDSDSSHFMHLNNI